MSRKLQPHKIPPSFFEPREDTAITWLGMAGLLVNSRGTILLIDPLITLVDRDGCTCSETDMPLTLPFLPLQAGEVLRADAVMYTHADADHFGRLTAQTLHRQVQPKFLAPPPVIAGLTEIGIPPKDLLVAHDLETFTIGTVRITITPTLHDWQEVDPWQRGDCCGFLIRTADGSVWHPGDTRLLDELGEFHDVDVLMFDVSREVPAHLGPEASSRLALTSGAKVMLAYHYGTYEARQRGGMEQRAFESDPDESLPFVKDVPGKFAMLDPGEVLRLPLAR